MKVILACLLFIGLALAELSCNCGWRNTGRIIGGKETRKNEYPWMVAVGSTKWDAFFCGGAIVTPWHIITAAHCVYDEKVPDLYVSVGAHNVNDRFEANSNLHRVEKAIMYPGYNNVTFIHDLAIIVTATEIKYNKFVGPVCMPSKYLGDEMVGQWLKAIGWGRTDPKTYDWSRIKNLKEVDLEVISNRDCRKLWTNVQYSGTQICTYTPRKDTCKGDSGGPLTRLDPETNRWTLVGVVSYGPDECGDAPEPGVNCNVSAYLKWINDNIKRTKSNVATCSKI